MSHNTSHSANYTIRIAIPEDAHAVAAFAQALAAYEGGESRFTAECFVEGIKKSYFSCVVAEHNAALIGMAIFYQGYDVATASRGTHLADIFVEESARGKGVGKSLMAAVATYTLEADGKWVSLTVLKHNSRAKAFYDSLSAYKVPVDFIALGETQLKELYASL